MVVSTAQAKGAATPIAQKELKEIADKLLEIPSEKRDDRKALLEELKKSIHAETKNFLDLTAKREIEHYELMEVIISKVSLLNDEDRKPHDFSKDYLFYFASATYFDGGIQTPEMKAFIDEELKRHYTMESHHPEHELYNDVECLEKDIVEMSLDRLARNAQFGNGIIDMEVLKKFLPKFPKGDNEAKQKIFWESAEKRKDLVQDTFFETYPDARKWAEASSDVPSEPPAQSQQSSRKMKCTIL